MGFVMLKCSRKANFIASVIKLLVVATFTALLLKKAEINFKIPMPEALKDFDIFMKHWCRVRRLRTDVESVLGTCKRQIKWTYKRNGTQTNASASFISRWELKPAGQFSRFFIQAVSTAGNSKTTGGDWWRVSILSPAASLRPAVFDLGNGTYEVLFLIVEPGVYEVDIILDYTLCDGFRDPPDNWFKLGK